MFFNGNAFSFCVFFFLLKRQPLRSTLFPYTTLFRSQASALDRELEILDIAIVLLEATGDLHYRDRKSTRLNSSHRCISYAVFCLKKKRSIGIGLTRLSDCLWERDLAVL